MKQPDPKNPQAKGIVLRHQEGDSWDFVAIEHIGKTAKVEVEPTEHDDAAATHAR